MIVWGRRPDGNRIFIDDAARGAADGLSCDCGNLLVAKKGELNAHHFAHQARSSTICRTAQLTALAEFAAKALEDAGEVHLPPFDGRRKGRTAVVDVCPQVYDENAVIELASSDGRSLLVVINLALRRKEFRQVVPREVSSIVINVGKYRNLADAGIARALVSHAPREWIFNVYRPILR